VERADLISAEAAVERDRAQLERAERLRETGVSSEQTLEEAQTAFAESQSALARIQAVLDQKAIEAPFAGIIGIPRIEVGEYVEPGTVVATLQQLDTMRVDFTVPEQRLDEISIGQAATFQLTTASSPYEGKITGIDPKIDPETRLVSVRAEVENSNGELRPGQFVRVRVALPEVPDVIALPQTAVVTSLYGDYVYVVAPKEQTAAAADGAASNESGAAAAPAEGDAEQAAETPPPGTLAGTEPQLVANQVFVEVGRRQGNVVEITKGLEPGQTVVTSGQNKLANNSPVIINNETDPAAVALEGGNGRS
jgi:membrane fusion protein (multidrug efflux system)